MSPRRYYFRSKDGTNLGPVSLNVVAEMIRSNKVKANTPISVDGSEYRPMKSFPELATLLSVDLDAEPAVSLEESAVVEFAAPTYAGTLTEVSFPRLLFHFCLSAASGRLELTNQTAKKEIYLLNGKMVAATSTLPRDQLGQHLVRNGLFSEVQLRQVLAATAENDIRLGEYLIQKKLIEPQILSDNLHQQFLQKIYEVFFWRVGRYAFYDQQEYQGWLLPMNLNPWEIIVEGVRQGYELAELREVLAGYRDHVVLPAENRSLHPNQLGLNPIELRVFKSLEGHHTLAELLSRFSGSPEGEKTVLSMIYMGIELELIALVEQDQSSPLPSGEMEAEELDSADHWNLEMSDPDTLSAGSSEKERPGGFITTPPVTPEEEMLLRVYNDLKQKDLFQRLNLSTDASSADVSRAFIKLARDYHPDGLPIEAPQRLKSLRADIFSLLNEAQQRLSNDQSRTTYRETLDSGFGEENVDIGHIIEAESCFKKGEILLRARKYAQAFGKFEEAIKLNPQEGEFHIFHGYAKFMSSENATDSFARQCIQLITKGLKMRDNSVVNGFIFIANIFKKMGNLEDSSRMYQRALAIEPNNVEASREVRLMSMRQEKKGSRRK